MSEPKRIQRKRTKGWRMPEGAVYVGRGSRWGNPYRVDKLSQHEAVAVMPSGEEIPESWGGIGFVTEWVVDAYRRNFEQGHWWSGHAIEELAGRDLACWCPLDQPCHADVLLEIANRTADQEASA